MEMIVLLYSGSELERVEIPLEDIETYIQLVKNHGYQDSEGNEYKFNRAQVDEGYQMTIYLDTA